MTEQGAASTGSKLQFSLLDSVFGVIVFGAAMGVCTVGFAGAVVPGFATAALAMIAALILVCCSDRTGWARRLSLLILIVPCLVPAGVLVSIVVKERRPIRSLKNAAAACSKTYAEAQKIYFSADHDGDGVREYAQTLANLLETKPGAADLMLIDKTFAGADVTLPKPVAKAGYIFKILTTQGGDAPGGAKTYIDRNGNMTGGYALVACPGVYDQTGRDTYIINYFGALYVKDLGAKTHDIVKQMTEFNPDSTWELWD